MKTIIKVTIFIMLVFCLYPTTKQCLFAEEQFYTTTNIEHLFSHCLIAYPDIAFDKTNSMKNSYNIDCITKDEFIKILNQLYKNNYALVSLYETFEEKDGKVVKKPVKMPIGKKPIVLSFDDVNYDRKKLHKGMVDKIIIDKNDNFATSTIIDGKEEIRYDNEFIPILEDFIKKHPDFSIRNAKATINVTGYDGILGYRTNAKNSLNRNEEINKVKPIIKKLKASGWTFASHSYGHYHMKKLTYEQFYEDVVSFNNEVIPLIGKTSVYVYPYGEWEVYENGEKCKKHKLLEQYGFKLFCGVGMKSFFTYLPTKCQEKVLFMDRKVIDGNSLRNNHSDLIEFFNTQAVYDFITRP